MRQYRYPTSMLHNHPDGYKYVLAINVETVLHYAPKHIGISNIQVLTTDGWVFVNDGH